MAPHFMLRIAPLSWERLEPLRFDETVAWADAVLELEVRLDEAARDLPDRIAPHVKGEGDDELRQTLINLRRDVFNSRTPRDPSAARRAAAKLPSELSEEIEAWLELSDRHREVRQRGTAIFRRELPQRRKVLQRLLALPEIRSGILLASPSLDEAIPRYLASDPVSPSKSARRVERSVSEYVYRTICKTSPFSTLTSVALGSFEDDVDDLLEVDPGGQGETSFSSHTRLNMAVIARVGEAILAEDEMLQALPLAISTGWSTDRRRVRYMRRQRRMGDAQAAMTLDSFDENVFFLAHSDIVEDIFALLDGGTTLAFGELCRVLHERSPQDRPRDEIQRYLRHLVRLNLLTVPILSVNIHARYPVADYSARIAELGVPWATRLAEDLLDLEQLASGYRDAGVDERRLILRDLQRGVQEMMGRLRVKDPVSPRTVLYEDTALVGTDVRAGRSAWSDGAAADLAKFARILPVFDALSPHRYMVRGFFESRYGAKGRCDDLIKFTHDFHLDVYDQYLRYAMNRRDFVDNEYQDQENWFKLQDIADLDEARRELIAQMRERYARHDGGAEMLLDDDFIDRIAAKLPPQDRDLDPRAYFAQVGDVEGNRRVILNRTYSGLSLLFSRFHHCFPEDSAGDLPSALREHLGDVTPEGAVLAEITGGYDTSNLNLHESVTPYEIVCPGEVSFRAPHEQIPIEDLFIHRDPQDGRLSLRSTRLDREVVPVYLGFLMPMALPDLQRLLLSFSRSRIAMLDLWSGTDKPLGGDEIGGHPRVRFGDLILVRQVWKTDPSNLPEGLLGAEGADRILQWRRWARRHGLPRYLFVTPDTAESEDEEANDGAMKFGKPQFVDLEDHFSLTLLDNLARRANRRLVFTEMLPGPEGLVARNADGERFVTELTLEINQKGGVR